MKPTPKQLAGAVEELAAIPFFPSEEGARIAITTQISRFVGDEKQLRWLVDAALGAMRKWEGLPELRGLFCTRFKPADGVEAYCSLPGYTANDCEAAHALKAAEGPKLLGEPPEEIQRGVLQLAAAKKI
jgi:hypothetical protein